MRYILHGATLDSQIWAEVEKYLALHPEKSLDQALDDLIAAGLPKADKATATIPVELLETLVECAEKTQRLLGMALPVETCLPIIQMADNARQHAQEFLPVQPMQWEGKR